MRGSTALLQGAAAADGVLLETETGTTWERQLAPERITCRCRFTTMHLHHAPAHAPVKHHHQAILH
jgi:hypothetical protein